MRLPRAAHSLFAQVFLTLAGVLVLFAVLMAAAVYTITHLDTARRDAVEAAAWSLRAEIAALPTPRQPADVQALLEQARGDAGLWLTVHDGRVVTAWAGRLLPLPRRGGRGRNGDERHRPRHFEHFDERVVRRGQGWQPRPRLGPVYYLRIGDGGWLAVHDPGSRPVHIALGIALLGIAVSLGAWLLARRLTSRLTRLQARVESLGDGDLGARVAVEGNDEVASLARAFNAAAARIEALLHAQRETLAAASHELRTPLARLRLASEMLGPDTSQRLRERMVQDIGELDELIEELLLVSRLRMTDQLGAVDSVDLMALGAEEAARFDAPLVRLGAAGAMTVTGDEKLLRRALRNLLHNARRHAPEAAVEVSVESRAQDGRVLVHVDDAGPGVAPDDRVRIFEQFERAGDASGGVGLGLWLVRRIAERHGGTVSVAGSSLGGARFTLALPARGTVTIN